MGTGRSEGPFGGPRPLAKEELTISAPDGNLEMEFGSRGPLGLPRPFAKPDPISQEQVDKCVNSQAAEEYIQHYESSLGVTVEPQKRKEMKRAWCKGELSFANNP